MKIVSNAFTQAVEEYKGQKILRPKESHDYDMIELEDGQWLRGYGDGRYEDDRGNSWGEVGEVDDDYPIDDPSSYDGEYQLLGYINL